MNTEVDDFLAHYGVKGMKWGVRRSQAQLDRAANRKPSTSGKSGSDQPKRRLNKKKVALAAGVVGATAAITVGAVLLNQKQKSAGQTAAMNQLKNLGGQSSWDVLKGVSVTQPSKSSSKSTKQTMSAGESAARKQIKDYANQSMWDIMTSDPPKSSSPTSSGSTKKKFQTPGQKRKQAGEAKAAAQIKQFAGRSMWDLATDSSLSAPPKKTSYSNRAKKTDTKLYGAKGAQRIQKRVDKGSNLSDARQREAVRRYGGTATKVALNVGSARAKENVKNRLRR